MRRLIQENEKSDHGKCDKFTIRGYVAEIRKKDWRMCWPFQVNEHDEQPSFPPLDEPISRQLCSQKCRAETATGIMDGNDETSVSCTNGYNAVVSSSSVEQALVPNSTLVSEEIDLNKPLDPNFGTDCLPIGNEIANKADVVHNGTTDHDVVSNVAVKEVDVPDLTNGLLSREPVASNHVTPVGDVDRIVKNDFQNCDVEKLTGSTRKRTEKTRLLSELCNEKDNTSPHCVSNPSAATHTPLVFPDKVHDQGDMTLANKGPGRKRKFLVDEEFCPGNNEVQNEEGSANKIDTVDKKHKKVNHVDNNLMPTPPQGQQRESEGTMDVTYKDAPSNAPFKGKGKVLQADAEVDSLSNKKNDGLVEVSFAHTGGKYTSSVPLSTASPSAEVTLNEQLVEGMNLSSKCNSSEQVHHRESIRQIEVQVPFSLHFQEATSRTQPIRKDIGNKRIPSNHMSDAISMKGKGVHLQVSNGGGNNDKTVDVIVLDSPERYQDPTREESEHISFNDIPREAVEIIARNQYERKNASGLLENSTQKGKSNICKTILQRDNEASVLWAPLTEKIASLGYSDLSKKAVSWPSNSNLDLNSPCSDALHKQNNIRDIDLNSPSCNIIDLEKLPTTIGFGNMSMMNPAYTFSGKVNGTEPSRNHMGTLDFDSNKAMQSMHALSLMGAGRQPGPSLNEGVNVGMLQRHSNTGECRTKLEIITPKTHGSSRKWLFDDFRNSSSSDIPVQHGKKFKTPPDFGGHNLTVCGKEEKMNNSYSVMQDDITMHLERPNLEAQSDPRKDISDFSIMLNRNPAEFALPDEESPYMIRGEDLKFEDNVPHE